MSTKNTYLAKLLRKPDDSSPPTWADHLELLCLANIDGELSEADIIDRFALRQKDLKEGNLEDVKEEEEQEAFEEEEQEVHEEKVLLSESKIKTRAALSDKWETKVKDWFKVLSMRSELYGECYPYIIDKGEIRLRPEPLSPEHRLYIFLLLCSNLYLFNKKVGVDLTTSFESLSYEAFRRLLPAIAEVHVFGKSPLNKVGKFKSKLSLWNKIKILANELHEGISHRMLQEDYPAVNTADGGLDLVAWIPTNDNLPSKLIFFAQCACGSDWSKKVHESSYDNWDTKIDFTTYPSNTMFIPYCFRKSNGGWQRSTDLKKAFLMDRRRILHFLFLQNIFNYNDLSANHIVDEICDVKEAVV